MKRINEGSGLYPKDSINNKEHPDHNKPGFFVKATKRGYYGLCLREPGDGFRIDYARHFADHNVSDYGWMEKADGPTSRKRGQVSQESYGAKPPPPDPSERDRKMARVDQMAKEAAEEDKAILEADVI